MYIFATMLVTMVLLLGISPCSAAHADEALPVTVQVLGELTVYPEEHAPATVVSLNKSRIAAEISARLEELPVKVGDRVEKGALLARLDCRDHLLEKKRQGARLRALDAQHELARFQLKRAESLAKDRNVSEELLNQRQAEMRVVEAQRQEQKIGIALVGRGIGKCALRAPFPALVTARLASLGEWLDPGVAVVKLLDLEDIEVSAQVPVTATGNLAAAGSIRFTNGEKAYPLELKVVLPSVDTRSRSREVRLTFTRDQGLPGTAGRIVWRNGAAHIPAALVIKRDGRPGIFTERDGQARFHPLPGAMAGRPAAITLAPETRVILEGRFSAHDGQRVQVQK